MSRWSEVQEKASKAGFTQVCGDRPAMFAANRTLGDCVLGCEVSKGKFLKGCTITVFAEQGRVKAVIRDPNSKLVGFTTLNGEGALGDALEAALLSDGIEWRKDKEGGKWG